MIVYFLEDQAKMDKKQTIPFVDYITKKKYKEMNKTKQQPASWSAVQRTRYKQGLLSKSEIKELETIPDWIWSQEDRVTKTAHGVFKRAKTRGSLPNWKSKDHQERKDAKWIADRRRSRIFPKLTWYPVLEEIAESYGFLNVFTTTEYKQKAINKAHEVFKRIKTKGIPKFNSKDTQEIKDYNWIKGHCDSKKGTGSWTWYPVLDKIAKSYGFPNIFDDRKQRMINRLHKILKQAKRSGHLPKYYSEDNKDAAWLGSRRTAKLKGKGIWYTELEEIAKKYGYPNLFERQR